MNETRQINQTPEQLAAQYRDEYGTYASREVGYIIIGFGVIAGYEDHIAHWKRVKEILDGTA